MIKDLLLKRLDKCITLGLEYKSLKNDRDISEARTDKKRALYSQWYSQSSACLTDVFGLDHIYATHFGDTCGNMGIRNIEEGLGILNAAKTDIEDGFVNGLSQLITAEIFSDILEMADHLLQEGYKDPGAIAAGIAFEAHLKGLSKTHGIDLEFLDAKGNPVSKKTSVLNVELCKSSVYNKLDEKSITAWLDLRNNAAHGHFNLYTNEQVKVMYSGVADFIRRIN